MPEQWTTQITCRKFLTQLCSPATIVKGAVHVVGQLLDLRCHVRRREVFESEVHMLKTALERRIPHREPKLFRLPKDNVLLLRM